MEVHVAKGFDTNANCTSAAKDIAEAGNNFVGRYYANAGKKRLTLAEARALGSFGLRIVAIWEDGYPTEASYFSYAKGVDDSSSAYHDASLIGQPKGSPIYFTVDFDASNGEIAGALKDYFEGITAGFVAAGRGVSEHAVGVYGSGATCAWVLARGLATYSWLAMPPKWSGSDFSGWSIKQSRSTPIAGRNVDGDITASDDYGGFMVF
jgi:hypothetical protein